MKKTSDIIGKICDVWMHELRTILKDQGVMLFMVIVPLAYPLLYSWIYNNEVVREVPVAAVDLAQTSQSRDFLRRCDASPDVSVCYQVRYGRSPTSACRAEDMGHLCDTLRLLALSQPDGADPGKGVL